MRHCAGSMECLLDRALLGVCSDVQASYSDGVRAGLAAATGTCPDIPFQRERTSAAAISRGVDGGERRIAHPGIA